MVLVEIVAGATGSLNVMVGSTPEPTPVAPDAGVTAVTEGGVVSPSPTKVEKMTSTQ